MNFQNCRYTLPVYDGPDSFLFVVDPIQKTWERWGRLVTNETSMERSIVIQMMFTSFLELSQNKTDEQQVIYNLVRLPPLFYLILFEKQSYRQ